jgi:hypothetical protein
MNLNTQSITAKVVNIELGINVLIKFIPITNRIYGVGVDVCVSVGVGVDVGVNVMVGV